MAFLNDEATAAGTQPNTRDMEDPEIRG